VLDAPRARTPTPGSWTCAATARRGCAATTKPRGYQLALAKIDAKTAYRNFVQVKLDSLGGAVAIDAAPATPAPAAGAIPAPAPATTPAPAAPAKQP
jgi:hypothetical protein